MLGWGIRIYREDLIENGDVGAYGNQPSLIVSWETGIFGDYWLDVLVEEGKAEQTKHGGYPNAYRAKAGDVLPLLEKGPPHHKSPPIIGDDYYTPRGWNGGFARVEETYNSCTPDTMLYIQSWDLS